MDPLQELFHELDGYDFQADPQRTQASRIHSILDQAIEHGGDDLQKHKPPLPLVIYALKSILLPSFLPELMSEFLHLFTMVEFYRLKITERASTLITWDTFYGGQEDSSFSLTVGQRKICKELEDAGKDFRKIYLIIVSHCCIVDLKRLWLANSNTDFWIRWNEYFSILKGENSETISHTFHYKMTHKEHSFLHEAAYEVSEFMEATLRWIGDQLGKGQSIQDVFKSNVFHEKFPAPELSSDVLNLIDYQLDSVQDAVRTVGTIKSHRD